MSKSDVSKIAGEKKSLPLFAAKTSTCPMKAAEFQLKSDKLIC